MTNTALVACVYAFPHDPPFRVMFIVCHIVLVHILANRVYRNIKLGLMSDIVTPTGGGGHGITVVGPLVFQDPELSGTRGTIIQADIVALRSGSVGVKEMVQKLPTDYLSTHELKTT